MTDVVETLAIPNGGHLQNRMAVWVDPDLCTGDANCATNVPEVFEMVDGVAYIVGDEDHEGGPGFTRLVPESIEERVLDEAEDCPGECIFVDVVGQTIPQESIQLGL